MSFDTIVAVVLITASLYALHQMVVAGRPKVWIALWGLWITCFFALEFLGLKENQTLSENLVASIPLPLLEAGTAVVCLVLAVHWLDLARKLVATLRGVWGR